MLNLVKDFFEKNEMTLDQVCQFWPQICLKINYMCIEIVQKTACESLIHNIAAVLFSSLQHLT